MILILILTGPYPHMAEQRGDPIVRISPVQSSQIDANQTPRDHLLLTNHEAIPDRTSFTWNGRDGEVACHERDFCVAISLSCLHLLLLKSSPPPPPPLQTTTTLQPCGGLPCVACTSVVPREKTMKVSEQIPLCYCCCRVGYIATVTVTLVA